MGLVSSSQGFPGGSVVKNLHAIRRLGFDPWVGKIPWRRERLPTPVFWPGDFLGLYHPRGCKELDTTEQHHPYDRKWRGPKKPLDESESGEWKSWLKALNIQKRKIMASGPITSWEIDGETVETVSDFIFWAPKSLQMVTAAMKLKDAYSLEGKLWPT